MWNFRFATLLMATALAVAVWGQHQGRRPFTTDTPMVHDPVMAYEDSLYHLYCTGIGIQHMTSRDRKTWTIDPTPVMTVMPQWTHDSVSGFQHHVWAPDIIRWHNCWWLAYSCSTFGKNGSAIGLLSTPSLSAPVWNDEGCIISSREGRDEWNAIDPCFVIDDNDQPWMTWGSFWDGIQLIRLDTTMHVAKGEQPRTIARRYASDAKNVSANPTSKYAGTNAIEAPFIYRHGGWYYLFVAWDYCCRGALSNYRVAVGRSRTVDGPYLDRNGVDMRQGGGTLVFEGDKKEYEAAGHSAVYTLNGQDIFICHGYSIAHNGASMLIQRPVRWTEDGWPEICNPQFKNPMLFSDVPDHDIIRVGDTYYMVSTTMHFAPGCGIMKSKDLTNWQIVNYAYDALDEGDNFRLLNGKSEYSNGQWATNLRYDPYEKLYYMMMTCNTTRTTYFYVTDDIENGRWHVSKTEMCYDPGLLFDDTGKEMKKYVLHPASTFDDHAMYLREMKVDKHWNVTVTERRKVIDYANLENPARGLRAEGYHGYKIGDYYYIFMIQGMDGQRQEIVWRSKDLFNGPWEGRLVFGGEMVDDFGKVVMRTNGIGQGGVVQAADGKWWCFLFKDYGSLGRMPVLLPMTWSKDGWPIVGTGKTSDELFADKNMTTPFAIDLPAQKSIGIVQSDEFDPWQPTKSKSRFGWRWKNSILGNKQQGWLNPVWQWNHVPDMQAWSLTERKGWLRQRTTAVVKHIREARNTLTQRTYGPTCQGEVLLDCSQLKDGDVAGLSCFQNRYGFVGAKKENDQLYIVMQKAMDKGDAVGKEMESVSFTSHPSSLTSKVYLRVSCDFRDLTDKATFSYSLDGKEWHPIGDTLQMHYDWPDFCGYRFALFHYATKEVGGIADFDYFHVGQ